MFFNDIIFHFAPNWNPGLSARYFGPTRSHTSSMVSPLVSVPL
jgi:hypothetical protein